MNYKARKRAASQWMKRSGLDALLITHLPDVRYLCGFTGSNAALVLTGGKSVLFTDGRYIQQAKEEAGGTKVVIRCLDHNGRCTGRHA
jgi:Xaa-Pro aminopeptidase